MTDGRRKLTNRVAANGRRRRPRELVLYVVFRSPTKWGVASIAAIVLIGCGGWAERSDARMTVVYDVPTSVLALIGTQTDGSLGLGVADGLFQQVAGPLPADRKVGALSGGVGSTAVATIRELSGPAIAALMREQVDLAGARMAFIDLGPDFDSAGLDGLNLEAAMVEVAATPFPGGGSYADRVHFYVSRVGSIAEPETYAAFWHAMSLTGGVWLEAYQKQVQWTPEYWLAWPRALREGLVARGMDASKIHIIVRGGGQAAVWANWRVGAACDLLGNGPGAYRIEDHLGFVQEFRATFGTTPAPTGPSPVACTPAPVLPEPRARQLADALTLEGSGVRVPATALSSRLMRTGTTTILKVSLGSDPLGMAARLGADSATFWAAAQGRVTVSGPGIATSNVLLADGTAAVSLTPDAHGPITLRLAIDGAAIRNAIGPPVDLAITLAPYRSRIRPVLNRMISQPTSWQLTIPLIAGLRAGPPPPRLTVRIVRREVAPKPSLVELRLSRTAKRLLVEVGVVKRGRYVRVRRLRITGTRVVVPVRLPPGVPIRAKLVPELSGSVKE